MGSDQFRDHFSQAAPEYAAFRPRYPTALFEALAACVPGRRLAWDCATGSGQAAIGLAEHYDRVVATDASAAQIGAALPHPRVEYRVAPAERSGLPAGSVDLVTVAQALHWLERGPFYAEAGRVLAPGGAIAVWCYALMEIDPVIDALVRRFYRETVGAYWPPGRALIDTGYRDVEFPFEEVPLPPLRLEGAMTMPALAGYLRTWSAVLRFRQATGHDPVTELEAAIRPLWGDPGRPREVRWPLAVRAGRLPGRAGG
ncbi:MAG: class I SAM-dependent methyltransferase [Candidatus Polarisedimenticolia bacterium]